MAESIEAIREFALQIKKSLITRNLYEPHMAPYQEAAARLLERCRAAVGDEGFTLSVGPSDLWVGKTSVLKSSKPEDSFFFPLYRDGLRELAFSPDLTPEELEKLMTAFEVDSKRKLGPSDDTMTYLWRCDLHAITYRAIDGIGDQEGDDQGPGAGQDDYRALVADLASKIQDPAPAVTGQSYAFVLDADVKVAASDLHYEATTTRRGFEENPTVLQLSPEEAAAIRREVEDERDQVLLARFIDILFVMLADPAGAVPADTVGPIFGQLLDGFWQAADFDAAGRLLGRLGGAADGVTLPEHRAAARAVVDQFLTAERVASITEALREGSLPLETAEQLWDLAGDGFFDVILGSWVALPEGALRTTLSVYLRRRAVAKPDLLRAPLAAAEVPRVRAALALMDERLISFYASELLALAAHADEAVRLKGVTAAGRLGGPAAVEALWKAMNSDASRSVRLMAFRLMAASPFPGLGERLRKLVSSPGFAERPAWEREKYVRLLGAVAGDSACALFESWVPARRWFWQARDLEAAELGLRGLAACGPAGLEKVKALASAHGKLGELAKKVLESTRLDPAEQTIPPAAAAGPRGTK